MLKPQTQQLVVGVGGGVMLLLQVTGLVVIWLQRRRVRSLDGRVSHLSAAMALLTDTLEGGLHDVAREVSRLASPASASAPMAMAVPRQGRRQAWPQRPRHCRRRADVGRRSAADAPERFARREGADGPCLDALTPRASAGVRPSASGAACA